jgi:hypothetical protein
VARGCTSLRHFRRRLRSRPLLRMGPEVRAAGGDYQRQGPAIYIRSVGCSLQTPKLMGWLNSLRARAAGDRWTAHLPWVMLGIRSAWREGTSFSPAEAVYGTQPILPGQYLAPEEDPSPSFLSDLQQTLAGRTLLPTSHHSTPAP